jgi:hypothetical protein
LSEALPLTVALLVFFVFGALLVRRSEIEFLFLDIKRADDPLVFAVVGLVLSIGAAGVSWVLFDGLF